MLTSVIASRTRTDDDDDGGNAIDAGRGARVIGSDATTTTQRRCALCARENSANGRRKGRGCDDGIDEPSERGDGAEPEQARRGRCDDDVAGEVELERRRGYARAHVDDRRRRGERRVTTAARRQINKKLPTLLNNTIFLAPPSRICPSQA